MPATHSEKGSAPRYRGFILPALRDLRVLRAIRSFHSRLQPDPEPPDDHADKRLGAQPECKDIGFAHCPVTCLNLGGEYVSITLTFHLRHVRAAQTCQPLLFFIALGLEMRPTSQRTIAEHLSLPSLFLSNIAKPR